MLTNEQAIIHLISIRQELQLRINTVGRKRSWRESEKAMTVANIKVKQVALNIAIQALEKNDGKS